MASAVAAPPAFSLESFYASRARAGEATVDGRLPVFSLREGLVVPQRPPEKDVAAGGQDARLAPAAGASRSEVARDEGAPGAPSTPDTTGAPARQGGAPGVMPALGDTVRVRTPFCLAWQGSFCTTCVERCPVEGAILVEAGRPRVVAERCDGCGTCVRVCPAPINAFELRPAGAPGVTS
jgi:ferredoxin